LCPIPLDTDASIVVDGKVVDDKGIQLVNDKKTHKIKVLMG
jgi:hypothetical protein